MLQTLRRNYAALSPIRQAWQRFLPLWCVLLLLALLPFSMLQRDLWTDEAFTASYVAHPTLDMVLEDVRRNEETPPIYFLLVWLWARVAGQSEIALRAPSLLLGVLAAALFARCVRRWLAAPEALLAGTILAVAPLVSSYLVEARGYTLTLLLTIVCVAAFERLYRRPESVAALVGYALAATALILTSYFGVAIVVAHNLIWAAALLRWRGAWRRRLVSWCAVQLFVGAGVL